jgi:hypothetical protein
VVSGGPAVSIPPGGLKALVEFTYADVQAVEVGGPGLVKRWSPVHQAMLTARPRPQPPVREMKVGMQVLHRKSMSFLGWPDF